MSKMSTSDKYFGSHEVHHRQETTSGGSDRNFGLVFATVFALIGVFSWYRSGIHWYWWLGAAGLCAAVALATPKLLSPLNRLWTKLGLLLFMVVSPMMLAIVFFLCVMPIGLLLRLLGKDVLHLKRQPHSESYWIERAPPGPKPDTLANQF